MTPSDLELHDATLQTWTLDFQARSLTLSVEAYMSEGDKTRRPARIIFRNISDLSCIADLGAITTNARAGNINYWAPASDGGISYIYLNEGCIAIKAVEIQLE